MGLPQMFLTKFWLYRTLKVRESSLTAAFTRCVQFPATLTSARSRTWSWPSRPSPKRASSGSWSRFRRSSHSTFVVMTRLKKKSAAGRGENKINQVKLPLPFPGRGNCKFKWKKNICQKEDFYILSGLWQLRLFVAVVLFAWRHLSQPEAFF